MISIRNRFAHCSNCGLCDAFPSVALNNICPRLSGNKREKDVLGQYEDIYLIKGRLEGTYSGSLISVLAAAIKSGLIDGVLGVGRGNSIIQPTPKYVTRVEDIYDLAGMRHAVSSHLSMLNRIPVDDRIAIVGLPCHIEGIDFIRKNGLLKHKVEYLIGIACGTNYEYSRFCNLIESHGVPISRIASYTLRDTDKLIPYFSFVLDDGAEHKIPVTKTISCIPSGCYYCNDYLGYASDISFGVLGAPKGYSLAFVRNSKGHDLLDIAAEESFVEINKIRVNSISKLFKYFYTIIPNKTYLSAAFTTKNVVGAELMAKFKLHFLNPSLQERERSS